MNSQVNNSKRFFIKTLGCKVNQYESQAMREILLSAGFKECLAAKTTDIFILNTCTVTGRSDKESRHMIALFHKTNPVARIVVTGCYVENGSDGVSLLPGVTNIVRNSEKNRIAEILLGSGTGTVPKGLKITGFKGHAKAFVKIQDGCRNACSYCKVPVVRPDLWSRPLVDILEEISCLAAGGFKEIVLTGICLGAWGNDHDDGKKPGLVGLLTEIGRIRGDFRVRLSSIEPGYITDELIEFISCNNNVCRHLHIPLQSGDDDILRKMNRPYRAKDYMTMIDRIKSKVKDIAITTDAMIGFPGESDENFRNTAETVKRILPLRVHIFPFSKRAETAAYAMTGEINRNIIKKRFYDLSKVSLGLSYLYRSKFLNTTLDILVETKRDKSSGLLKGYSGNYIKVLFEGKDDLMKEVVPVNVEHMNLTHTF